jgi:hypothetical protein
MLLPSEYVVDGTNIVKCVHNFLDDIYFISTTSNTESEGRDNIDPLKPSGYYIYHRL